MIGRRFGSRAVQFTSVRGGVIISIGSRRMFDWDTKKKQTNDVQNVISDLRWNYKTHNRNLNSLARVNFVVIPSIPGIGDIRRNVNDSAVPSKKLHREHFSGGKRWRDENDRRRTLLLKLEWSERRRKSGTICTLNYGNRRPKMVAPTQQFTMCVRSLLFWIINDKTIGKRAFLPFLVVADFVILLLLARQQRRCMR